MRDPIFEALKDKLEPVMQREADMLAGHFIEVGNRCNEKKFSPSEYITTVGAITARAIGVILGSYVATKLPPDKQDGYVDGFLELLEETIRDNSERTRAFHNKRRHQ